MQYLNGIRQGRADARVHGEQLRHPFDRIGVNMPQCADADDDRPDRTSRTMFRQYIEAKGN